MYEKNQEMYVSIYQILSVNKLTFSDYEGSLRLVSNSEWLAYALWPVCLWLLVIL